MRCKTQTRNKLWEDLQSLKKESDLVLSNSSCIIQNDCEISMAELKEWKNLSIGKLNDLHTKSLHLVNEIEKSFKLG